MSHPLRHTVKADADQPPQADQAPLREPPATKKREAPKEPRRVPAPLRRLRTELITTFAIAGVITLFVNIGLLFVPIYDMILYDRVLQSKNMDTLAVLTIGVAVSMMIFGSLEFCRASIFVILADRVARRLNLPTLEAAIRKSLQGAASTAAQAMRDLNELRLFVSGSAATVPLDLIWTPALLVVLFMLHPAYGVFGLLCAGFLFLLSLITDLSTRAELVRANGETAKGLNDLSAALRHTELLDGMGMLPDVARRWNRRQGATLDHLRRTTRRSKALMSVARTSRLLMQGGIIALGTILVLHGEASPGSMMGANLLIAKLLQPFELLVVGWRQWISALSAWCRVRDLLGEPKRGSGEARPDQIAGRLTLEHVSFTPPGAAKPVLEDISFAIEPGEAVGVVGPSGSGKSSLARLIVGVFTPSAGEISLGGIPLASWDRTALGRHVGYLPQAIALLDGTVLDNIARMQEGEPLHVIEAATAAGIHDLIGRLPEGYSTWIGGTGYALSGGQQQRVALARALFARPKLLVLDEPNSNLDHIGEEALVETIVSAKRRGAAVLLITHRPNVLAAVDKVVVIEGGRITRIVSADDYFATIETRIEAPKPDPRLPGRLVPA